MERYGKKWPLMQPNFDGLAKLERVKSFGEREDLAQDVKEMLKLGSMNLFLLEGGTTDLSVAVLARKTKDLPQI